MVNQPVRLLVSVRTYQAANSVFLSQQTSTSQAYQPRNQPANGPNKISQTFLKRQYVVMGQLPIT